MIFWNFKFQYEFKESTLPSEGKKLGDASDYYQKVNKIKITRMLLLPRADPMVGMTEFKVIFFL